MSFPVGEKCLLAVVGPSGAGKSTLLNALTGQRPADQGTVLYDGRDLYRDYAELRQRIGLVPQDDILHAQLTVRRALAYAAELRFPQDTAKAERQARVDEVIARTGPRQRADQPIHSLSGGQRKRVSVALELLTKPSLLFLDEPTSGLDPGMDRSVMHMLRGLADDGRTVIVVTHSVLSLDVCDRLLVLAPGRARSPTTGRPTTPSPSSAIGSGPRRSRPSRTTRTGTGRGSTGPRRSTASTSTELHLAAPDAGRGPAGSSAAAQGPELGLPAAHPGPAVRGRARRRPDLPDHHDRPAVRHGRDGAGALAGSKLTQDDGDERAAHPVRRRRADRRRQRRAGTGQGTDRSTSANGPSACPDRRT